MLVTGVFKPADENLSVLIAHSTAGNLGECTAEVLRDTLDAGVHVEIRRITNFSDLVALEDVLTACHVFILLAHGRTSDNTVRLFDDFDVDGRALRVNVGEMKAALEGRVADKLCLFGVCHYGTQDLADAVCKQAGAVACIAPKPPCTIGAIECVSAFSCILNEMQEQRQMPFDTQLLHEHLMPKVRTEIQAKLNVCVA